MPELSFRLIRSENGLDGSVEPNACDSGLTETAILHFEDEQGFGVSGTVSAQISKDPLLRSIIGSSIRVDLDDPDDVNADLYEQTIQNNIDLHSAFNQICQQQ